MKFVRRRPAVFQAIQYTGENRDEVIKFINGGFPYPFTEQYVVKDKEGNMEVMDEEEFKKEFESC